MHYFIMYYLILHCEIKKKKVCISHIPFLCMKDNFSEKFHHISLKWIAVHIIQA